MLESIEKPKCPAIMPVKKTNVTPSEMPKNRILPNPSPMAVIVERTMTACRGLCSKNRLFNHSMLQMYMIIFRFSYEVNKKWMTTQWGRGILYEHKKSDVTLFLALYKILCKWERQDSTLSSVFFIINFVKSQRLCQVVTKSYLMRYWLKVLNIVFIGALRYFFKWNLFFTQSCHPNH